MNMLSLDEILVYTKDAIALIGVAIIVIGSIRSLYQYLKFLFKKQADSNAIRLQLGDAVVLGLEFMVGADIVGSLVEPDYYNLGLLGLLVLIRIVLSYFLNMELQSLSAAKKGTL